MWAHSCAERSRGTMHCWGLAQPLKLRELVQAVARGIKRLPANASITAAEELVRSSILRECRAFNRRKPEVIIGGLPC